MRMLKSWVCNDSECRACLFDSLGSLVEHLHKTHGISDFRLLPKNMSVFERRFQVNSSQTGSLDDGKKVIISDDLSEIINYHETVTKNKLEKLATFRASMPTKKGNNESQVDRFRGPIRMQNLIAAPNQIYRMDNFRKQNYHNSNNNNPFKDGANLASIEELKDQAEAVDRDTLDEASEESRLTIDKINAVNNSPSPRRNYLSTSKIGLLQFSGISLEKRASLECQDSDSSDCLTKKIKRRLGSSPQHTESSPAMFSNSISLGNLAFK
jgi:hypothetical protein